MGLLAYLVSRNDPKEIIAVLSDVDLRYLVAATALYAVGYVLGSLRWQSLLALCGVKAPLGGLVSSYLVAGFFNNIFPSTIGGDAVRAYDSTKYGTRKVDAVTTIVVDRFLGVISLGLYACIGVFAIQNITLQTSFQLPVLVFVAVLVVGVGIVLTTKFATSPRPRKPGFLAGKVHRLKQSIGRFQGEFRTLSKCLLLALVFQANIILFHLLTGYALGIELSPMVYAFVVPVVVCILIIPVTIGGVGLREGLFVLFLGHYAVQESTAIAFSLLIYFQSLAQGALGGLVFLFRNGFRDISSILSLSSSPDISTVKK